MPRGGGFHGGGGFGGGGFRGGGFRSGGFGGSFRSSSFRSSSSSRPFGRTGAHRTNVSRSGPYHHTQFRPHHHYHHHGYFYNRPYYYHSWWYRPYFWGYYYRPWYYSPVYVGGGIIVFIILMLILLPLIFVSLSFPFGDGLSQTSYNYRSTETLYFGEYWYEYESLNDGATITYEIQSSIAPISFMIADHPFEDIAQQSVPGTSNFSATLGANDGYWYESFYAGVDSDFSFTYQASSIVDFFITDTDGFSEWFYYGNPYFIYETTGDSVTDTITIKDSGDLYFVWSNENPSMVDVNYSIDYTLEGGWDFSPIDSIQPVAIKDTQYIAENTISVDHDGTWYFFIYFDPTLSYEASTSITFDVTFNNSPNVNDSDKWASIRPVLIIFLILITILILVGVSARKTQKQKGITAKSAATTTLTSQSPTTVQRPTQTQQSSTSPSMVQPKQTPTDSQTTGGPDKCSRCGTIFKKEGQYCPSCGKKREGRKIGPEVTTKVSKSQICSFCGSKVHESAKYCGGCGSIIQQ